MVSIPQQRLALLVNREQEIANFCAMLDDAECLRPVMAVWGGGGMGKSSLLMRMMHECSLRTLTKAEVFWTDIYNHDYLAVMRKIRDDIGAEKFSEFTQTVNYYYRDESIHVDLKVDAGGSVGEGMVLKENARVGQMANVVFEPGSIVVKDQMETRPRRDLAISDSDRMRRITEQFIKELNAVAAQGRVVIFLDATEKATEVTQRWIWDALLESLRQGQIFGVNFIVSGRQERKLDDKWKLLVDEERLGPLAPKYIGELIDRMQIKVPDESRPLFINMIATLCEGNPLKIANAAGELARMTKNQNSGEKSK